MSVKKSKGMNLMSQFVDNDNLLIVSPVLSKAIGVKEAMVLNQLHYWLDKGKKVYKGKVWVYKTYENWAKQDFTFWKAEQVKYIFTKLRKLGLVLVEKLADNRYNRVNYYSINYEKLASLFKSASKKFDTDLSAFFWNPVINATDNFILINEIKNNPSIRDVLSDVKENKTETKQDTNHINNKTAISDNFEPDTEQLTKMAELGIDPAKEVEFFVSRKKSTGETSACWKSSFTYWLNKAVSMGRVKTPAKTLPNAPQHAVNDFDDDLPPAFRAANESPDSSVKKDPSTTVMFNGRWFEPLPNMTAAETYKYVGKRRRGCESLDETYLKLLGEFNDGRYLEQA